MTNTHNPKFKYYKGVGSKSDLQKEYEKQSQAERVIAKFGGARKLYRLLKEIDPECCWNPSSIYRWTYPREKGGTGGVIPSRAMKIIVKAARLHGVLVDGDDFFPGRR